MHYPAFFIVRNRPVCFPFCLSFCLRIRRQPTTTTTPSPGTSQRRATPFRDCTSCFFNQSPGSVCNDDNDNDRRYRYHPPPCSQRGSVVQLAVPTIPIVPRRLPYRMTRCLGRPPHTEPP